MARRVATCHIHSPWQTLVQKGRESDPGLMWREGDTRPVCPGNRALPGFFQGAPGLVEVGWDVAGLGSALPQTLFVTLGKAVNLAGPPVLTCETG